MISLGNWKLGKSIFSWSLPAYKTCPGASDVCVAICYAMRGRFTAEYVQRSQSRNWRRSRSARFVERMLTSLAKYHAKIVRVHASGDFYSADYVRAWIRIAKRRPQTIFFAYTRSWEDPTILRQLVRLSQLPNVQLWFSGDRSMRCPPRVTGVRLCYLSVNDEDLPRWKPDLVFRERPGTSRKRLGRWQTLVCPVEQHVERQVRLTCDKCRICFRDAARQQEQLYALKTT